MGWERMPADAYLGKDVPTKRNPPCGPWEFLALASFIKRFRRGSGSGLAFMPSGWTPQVKNISAVSAAKSSMGWMEVQPVLPPCWTAASLQPNNPAKAAMNLRC